MDIQVTIKASAAQIERLRATYGDEKRGKAATAIQAAVSRTVVSGVKLISGEIADEVFASIADIKASIDSTKGTYDDPTGRISVSRDRLFWLADYLSTAQRTAVGRKAAGGGGGVVGEGLRRAPGCG